MTPLIFRVMKAGPDDDKPVAGGGPAMLGVRPADVGIAEDATDASPVGPGSGGMSVAGCVRTLLPTLLPKRFAQQDPERFRGARASNSQWVWVRGEGPYEPGPITADLSLHIEQQSEPPGHGLVEPRRATSLGEYQAALAATRAEWRVEEGHPDDCPVCQRFGLG